MSVPEKVLMRRKVRKTPGRALAQKRTTVLDFSIALYSVHECRKSVLRLATRAPLNHRILMEVRWRHL